MLKSLYIKNLAIIDELHIQFENGLNIITGETGAGKTLIIKAIQLLLGKKYSSELLRTGTNSLVVEGVFDKGGTQTLIRRLYHENGRSKSFLNDEPVKQKDLLKITRKIVDLHGQHDHQNLLDSDTHLHYLDAFGPYHEELTKLKKIYFDTDQCQTTLAKLIHSQKEFDEKKELFEFQLKELTAYPITLKYEKEISERYSLLSNASEIKIGLTNIVGLMEDGESALLGKLNQIAHSLEKISRYNSRIEDVLSRVESSRIELEDLLHEIQTIQKNIEVNNHELNDISNILTHIETLKRKYGGSIESVMEYRDSIINADKVSVDNASQIKRYKEDLETLNSKLLKSAELISKLRSKTATHLESEIKKNLKHLNMPNTKFKINLTSAPDHIQETGIDTCEFFISTNVGEELRPVSKIASGGEISRIMLAIKMALQSSDMVNTMVFDEIDSGISGVTAERVGETFENLAKSHQIICITHLSQIAGKGAHHFRVQKKVKQNRITTEVNKLSESERIYEIAGLISGRKITESSRKQAEELLQFNG